MSTIFRMDLMPSSWRARTEAAAPAVAPLGANRRAPLEPIAEPLVALGAINQGGC
eukprot:CAMPEP_0118863022 /NCGR_PEP_ID=MMETSP1163-20130328/8042_1 /TAXON_ID=124430 /ORGANISM="Phaeomonas parva, Strain CCMP2877" /LENGTH=54 /DNA_ID=CAMNT_0006796987 /DNA_START=285 /DNA_END=449 /DNA_ORIENTATION=+